MQEPVWLSPQCPGILQHSRMHSVIKNIKTIKTISIIHNLTPPRDINSRLDLSFVCSNVKAFLARAGPSANLAEFSLAHVLCLDVIHVLVYYLYTNKNLVSGFK